MIALLCFLVTLFASPLKSRSRLEAENAALRYQLIVLRPPEGGTFPSPRQLVAKVGRRAMSRVETGTAELPQGVDRIDWRHFWLKNVIDSGKLAQRKLLAGNCGRTLSLGVCKNFIA